MYNMKRNFLHRPKSTVLIVTMGDFAKPVETKRSYTIKLVSFHLHFSSFWFWIQTICVPDTLSPKMFHRKHNNTIQVV